MEGPVCRRVRGRPSAANTHAHKLQFGLFIWKNDLFNRKDQGPSGFVTIPLCLGLSPHSSIIYHSRWNAQRLNPKANEKAWKRINLPLSRSNDRQSREDAQEVQARTPTAAGGCLRPLPHRGPRLIFYTVMRCSISCARMKKVHLQDTSIEMVWLILLTVTSQIRPKIVFWMKRLTMTKWNRNLRLCPWLLRSVFCARVWYLVSSSLFLHEFHVWLHSRNSPSSCASSASLLRVNIQTQDFMMHAWHFLYLNYQKELVQNAFKVLLQNREWKKGNF